MADHPGVVTDHNDAGPGCRRLPEIIKGISNLGQQKNQQAQQT
ncbi:hypothetical protein CUTER_00760 [Corynebacterium uterequi]|uniref:Uncharacterized protein n=1 Tax=Corynebacterium uterequi TaxID=1072256 RepID=A0A0G3HA40_9CORY|nr:hypothetical protein CUTER_00760 [Corynebacterium uterequi]